MLSAKNFTKSAEALTHPAEPGYTLLLQTV